MRIPTKGPTDPDFLEGEVVETYEDEEGRTIRVIHEHRVVEEKGRQGPGCCGCLADGCLTWFLLGWLFGSCG